MLGFIDYPSWLSPQIIPGFFVRWYGLMYIVAFGITWWLFNYQIKERSLEISKDKASSLFGWIILGLVLGARIGYAVFYDVAGQFRSNPFLIFWPFDSSWNFTGLAGLSFHGGMVGALVGAWVGVKKNKLDFLVVADLITAALPLGYTFGRLGNFINGELYGRVTDVPWGMIFPEAQRLPTSEPWVRDLMTRLSLGNPTAPDVNLPRHPSQLYEALGEGLLLWFIFWVVLGRRPRFRGFFLGLFLVGYGTVRFLVEYLRNPDKGLDFPLAFDKAAILDAAGNPVTSHLIVSPWNFSMGQILSSFMILGGVAFLLWRWKAEKKPL